MEDYKSTPMYKNVAKECTEDDLGVRQVSCRYTEIGSLDGNFTVKDRTDPRWQKIQKYWNNPGLFLKFSGVACARGSLEAEANKIAMDRAQRLVTSLTVAFEGAYFTGYLHGGYRKRDFGWKCVATANTSKTGGVH
jgi:hypothetical protein